MMNLIMASFGFGLVTAAVLAISAVGFTMQFAVTDVLNLAYSGVMMVGAFVAYWIASAGAGMWVGVIAAMVTGSVLSVLLNQGIFSPFQRRGASPIILVIVALGMLLILEFGLQAIVGGSGVSYPMQQSSSLDFLGVQLSPVQLITIAVAVVAMVGVHVLLRYTRLGKAMRATASNRSLARTAGIRTDRVITTTWLISGALCGLGGCIFAINTGTFAATSADLFLVLVLSAVFVGGPGHSYGAMIGAVIIGMATELSAAFITPSYKDVIAFVILLAVLSWRPSGLLAPRT